MMTCMDSYNRWYDNEAIVDHNRYWTCDLARIFTVASASISVFVIFGSRHLELITKIPSVQGQESKPRNLVTGNNCGSKRCEGIGIVGMVKLTKFKVQSTNRCDVMCHLYLRASFLLPLPIYLSHRKSSHCFWLSTSIFSIVHHIFLFSFVGLF